MAIKKTSKVAKKEEMTYLSDDSDFYGDEAVQQDMEDRASSFDPAEWWKRKVPSLTEMAIAGAANKVDEEAVTLYNPYEGAESCGRQLGESVDEFLERLPPATTPVTERRPWIYVANPFRKAKKPKDDGEIVEAPPDEDSNWAKFVVLGGNLLEELTILRHDIEKEKPNAAKATITRAVNPKKDAIVKKLLQAAVDLGCVTGKWMIFCPSEDVNQIWAVIARATVSNDLGIAAKVAPKDPEDTGDRKMRLICIYTKDFTDEADVTRVITKLKNFGLIDRGKPLYYKCDAYTYLGLKSDNEYNIQASMYKSSDFFTSKGQPPKVKTEGFFYKKKEVKDYKSVEWE